MHIREGLSVTNGTSDDDGHRYSSTCIYAQKLLYWSVVALGDGERDCGSSYDDLMAEALERRQTA
jgi:hypothetical protein